MDRYKIIIEKILHRSGVRVNGHKPYDILVHNDRFFKRVVREGSLGLGESYMEGWWDCDALDEFFARALGKNLEIEIRYDKTSWIQALKTKLFNLQTKKIMKKTIAKHYDVGNDLYKAMLDPYMMYSCGYWDNASTLEEAQENKLRLICEKLHLKPGMKVLDIGCGWGGFAAFASEKYQVEVTGLTISKAQAALARQRCEGLPVEILLQDYRDHQGLYDRILSIGMIEHVGAKNYPVYMKTVHDLLREDGISLIHTIGSKVSNVSTDPWIDRYIFANSLIPSATQLTAAMEPYFILEDLHNFGLHYDYTLMEWLKRFKSSWPQLQENYDDGFYRMWVYYLSSCAAAFRVRKNNLWQFVMIKSTFPEEYIPVRSPHLNFIGSKEGGIIHNN